MNTKRRKQIAALKTRLDCIAEKYYNAIHNIEDELEDISTHIEDIKCEEEDAYDNLPESLQLGEKGEQMQGVIDLLDEAQDELQRIANDINDFGDNVNDISCLLEDAMA